MCLLPGSFLFCCLCLANSSADALNLTIVAIVSVSPITGKLQVLRIFQYPSEGTLQSWRPDGSFVWVPPANFTGTTSFSYRWAAAACTHMDIWLAHVC